MKLKALCLSLIMSLSCTAFAKQDRQETEKTAKWFCSSDTECIDVISLDLDSMYYQGLNERDPVTIGTLINRKAKALSNYCEYAPDKDVCEAYKAQLMLKYMSGLLER